MVIELNPFRRIGQFNYSRKEKKIKGFSSRLPSLDAGPLSHVENPVARPGRICSGSRVALASANLHPCPCDVNLDVHNVSPVAEEGDEKKRKKKGEIKMFLETMLKKKEELAEKIRELMEADEDWYDEELLEEFEELNESIAYAMT